MPESTKGLHVIVVGNPLDGLTIYGPYKTFDQASIEAERITDTEYWIMDLKPPAPLWE